MRYIKKNRIIKVRISFYFYIEKGKLVIGNYTFYLPLRSSFYSFLEKKTKVYSLLSLLM